MKTRFLVISLITACVSPRPEGTPPESVRDRLATGATTMFVYATKDAGALGAAHNTGAGWQTGSASLSISTGAFVASSDDSGLVVSTLDLSFDPIDVPPEVFGTPAQLTNVRLQLPAPVPAPLTWSDNNNATAVVPLELSLTWSIEVNGGVLPLGAQNLPVMPLDVTFGGDGDSVTASLALHGAGKLWSWADLLELTQLDVTADAVTE